MRLLPTNLFDRYAPIFGILLVVACAWLGTPNSSKAALDGPIYCSEGAQYDSASAQTLRVIAGAAGGSIILCGMDVSAVSAQTAQLVTGTGTNCGTNTANFSPQWNIAAGVNNFGAELYVGMGILPPLTDLCFKTTAAVSTQAMIYFKRQ